MDRGSEIRVVRLGTSGRRGCIENARRASPRRTAPEAKSSPRAVQRFIRGSS
jgi:hypothetical protein